MSPRISIRALMLLVVATVAACSTQTTGVSPPAEEPPDAPASPPPESAGGEATSPEGAELLSFEAPRLGGGTIRGADFESRDLALWFWAPW